MNFKRFYLPLMALALAVACSKVEIEEAGDDEKVKETEVAVDHSIVRGEAVVRFSDDMISLIEADLAQGKVVTRSMGLNQALDEIGITSIRRLFPDAGEFEERTRREGLHKWYVVSYRTDVPQTRAASELESVPGVEFLESRRKVEVAGFDDPDYSKQWGYLNTVHAGYDINVVPVWNNYTVGDPKVVVAVVDQGVDITHPDLAANCGSLHYSAINYNNTVVPGSHGTHVAGTIAAVNNNGIGCCGVAGGDAAKGEKGVTIMSCEILRDVVTNGKTETLNGSVPTAIKWAADHGAVICQNSWAYSYDMDGDGKLNSSELAKALAGKVNTSDRVAIDYFIKYAGCDNNGNQLPDSPMKGGLVVFAAGNENIANGVPANYEPVVAVAAIESSGAKAWYSNYGDFIDIAAPGSSVYSTFPGGKYGNLSGTSMACPHVSGVAALLVSCLGGPDFTCDELKERLLSTKRKELVPSSIGGLVDAMGALAYGGDFVPEMVKDLKASALSNEVSLTWSVTGDADGHPAFGYSVLTGKDKALVESADPANGKLTGVLQTVVTIDGTVGEAVSVDISDLDFSTTYYVKVVGYSYARSYGEASDVLSFVTGRNNPPVIELGSGSVMTLKAHETAKIDVSIHDPDGHDFTVAYKPGSAADSFARTLDGKMTVTIKAPEAEPGEYSGEISATDKYGAVASKSISYIILENTPPRRIKDLEDVFASAVGTEFSLNASDYFTDPDGEDLTYSFTVSNPSVVHMNRNGNRIIGTVLKYGAATVTVTAADARKATATAEFRILAREASIEYVAYPNPVTDVLNLATGKDVEDVHIKITSITGKTVFEGDLKASAFSPAKVDMSACAPGRYTAVFKVGTKEHRCTIVKK